MVHTEESWHTLPDGVKLYTKTWIVSNHRILIPLSLFCCALAAMSDAGLDDL